MKSLSSCGAPRTHSGISLLHLRIFFLFVLLAGLSGSAHALDYYWVGGSGLWSDHNNHWATSSGGNVFHDQVPTSMDNVYFDANSFPAGGTVTIDPTIIYCMDMDWTGATGTPVFEGPSDKQVWIYGSLTLISGMEWKVLGEVHFRAFQTGETISTNSINFVNTVFFEGIGGEWTFLDEFTVGNGKEIYHLSGTIRTNNQTVNTGFFIIDGGNGSKQLAVYLGSSVVNITDGHFSGFGALGPNFHLDAGTSTIIFHGPGYLSLNSGNIIYDVVFKGQQGYIEMSGQFHSVLFEKDGLIYGSSAFESLTFTAGYIYRLAGNQTITPGGQFNASGTDCSNFIYLTPPSFQHERIVENQGLIGI